MRKKDGESGKKGGKGKGRKKGQGNDYDGDYYCNYYNNKCHHPHPCPDGKFMTISQNDTALASTGSFL